MDPPKQRGGRPRRRPWASLPSGRVLTLTEAAEVLQMKRNSLRSYLHNRKDKLPKELVTIWDNHRIVGIKWCGGGPEKL